MASRSMARHSNRGFQFHERFISHFEEGGHPLSYSPICNVFKVDQASRGIEEIINKLVLCQELPE